MNFAIIGAGMSGLACAEALSTAGHTVALFDKGRAAGGRMATRRLQTSLGEVTIDHGAQYFTARDPAFQHLVREWQDLGIAAPWPPAGPDAWIGVPGMNALMKWMASAHCVTRGHLATGLIRRPGGWGLVGEAGETGPFDAVVLAIPAEQAANILALHDAFLQPSPATAKGSAGRGGVAWGTDAGSPRGKCPEKLSYRRRVRHRLVAARTLRRALCVTCHPASLSRAGNGPIARFLEPIRGVTPG